MNERPTKVFFDMSTKGNQDVWETLNTIADNQRWVVTYNWNKKSSDQIQLTSLRSREDHYNNFVKKITSADFCIFDISQASTRIGHELTLAIQKKIPTLVLVHKKSRSIKTGFFQGIRSPIVAFREYENPAELRLVVLEFINRYKDRKKVRLDINLRKDLYDFVSAQAKKKKTSRIEIIRNILNS